MKKLKKIIKCIELLAVLNMFLFISPARAASSILNSQSTDKILSYLMVSNSDIKHYKRIFRALKKSDFETMEEEISELDNDILMGNVLAEKYLSAKYKSNFDELKNWLNKYSDHPQANRIYKLALRKGKSSDLEGVFDKQKQIETDDWLNNGARKFSPADKKFIYQKLSLFKKSINKGKTKIARSVLENKRFKRLVPNKELDAMAATLAMKYLLDNYDKLAFEWAAKASKRSNNATASWVAGLSAWRMKQYKTASTYFSRLAQSGNKDEWLVSAGAYWAYRANDVRKQREAAAKWLKIASRYKRTFYGILANYRLGNTLNYNWTALSYLNDFRQDDYIDEIMASPAIRRAILLLYAKQNDLAEKELRYAYEEMNDKQKEVTLFLADQYKMHALSIQISNSLKDEERDIAYDAIAYPVPTWQPKSGWKVEKALILALTRQESSFSPKARSAAGACGLMQLLPNTAFHITKDRRLKNNITPLLDAEYNMELGQQYINYLLEKKFIDGNLFYLMAAYNAGPGNLVKWQKKVQYNNDPLLFIEVIPARETRIYIERVMANLWIYQSRFGQELSGIKALSKGQWPMLKEE